MTSRVEVFQGTLSRVEVFQGDVSVLRVTEAVYALAERFEIAEVAFDPWRASKAELGLVVVDLPQSHARATQFSEGLQAAIVEGLEALRAPRELNAHVAAAVEAASDGKAHKKPPIPSSKEARGWL